LTVKTVTAKYKGSLFVDTIGYVIFYATISCKNDCIYA